MDAPPEKVFALIDDDHNWDRWKLEDQDSTMKKSYSGSARDEGAVKWEGSGSTGKGRMTITESVPPPFDDAVAVVAQEVV